MADDRTITTGRRRGRGAESLARSEALEHLKVLRCGGRRLGGGGFQIKLERPIYDTVPEDEYDALVAKRREESRGFIVDDDGLVYGDEGEEEDWSKAGFALSSDESERPKRKKLEKKDSQPKKSCSSLSAAAAMIGAQRLSSMFTSSLFKKSRDDKVKGFSCDSIVDDVIAEFAPDETDRQRRRRQVNSMSGTNNIVPINNVKSEKPPPDLMSGSLLPDVGADKNLESTRVLKDDDCALDLGQDLESVRETTFVKESEESVLQSHNYPTNGDVMEEKMTNDVTTETKPATKEAFALNGKIKAEDPAMSATAGWQATRSGGDICVSDSKVASYASNREDNSDFNLEADGSLPFYILDAHEEFYGANIGRLYLFGKVKAGDSYQSCCVVVKNMNRCVYAIPNRPLHYTDELIKLQKDVEESRISTTDFNKKLQDLMCDLKSEIAKQRLDQKVSTFSLAPVKRKYAFELSEIPAGENCVLKINYPFKDPPLPLDLKGESFCDPRN